MNCSVLKALGKLFLHSHSNITSYFGADFHILSFGNFDTFLLGNDVTMKMLCAAAAVPLH